MSPIKTSKMSIISQKEPVDGRRRHIYMWTLGLGTTTVPPLIIAVAAANDDWVITTRLSPEACKS